jgi:hypothetical protein
MPALEVPQTLPDRIAYLLHSVVEFETPHAPLSEIHLVAWQELIAQLSAWARDPQQLRDEDIEPPSNRMIQLAMDVASVMRDRKIEAPDRIVPNGDGGLVFRWRSGEFTWSLELDVDGSMETTLMEEHMLVCRHSLHIPASPDTRRYQACGTTTASPNRRSSGDFCSPTGYACGWKDHFNRRHEHQ